MTKRKWKTRKRGTPRQVGKPFPITSSQQQMKTRLPKVVGTNLKRKLSQGKQYSLKWVDFVDFRRSRLERGRTAQELALRTLRKFKNNSHLIFHLAVRRAYKSGRVVSIENVRKQLIGIKKELGVPSKISDFVNTEYLGLISIGKMRFPDKDDLHLANSEFVLDHCNKILKAKTSRGRIIHGDYLRGTLHYSGTFLEMLFTDIHDAKVVHDTFNVLASKQIRSLEDLDILRKKIRK